jgi:hypothetical protein
MADRPKARTLRWRSAGEDHAVVLVEGGPGGMMPRPCPECPWRRENAGSFPAEAFRHSAYTAYDCAEATFGCHMSDPERARTCAGAALRTDHSLALRMRWSEVEQVEDPGEGVLFTDYREMAIANGVDPDEEVLRPCR